MSEMKLGFGLYRHMLNPANMAFARQAGASHVVIHLIDYFRGDKHLTPKDAQPTGDQDTGWGLAGDPNQLWTVQELREIKKLVEDHGLVWEAIENIDPSHWHDILLDGPKKKQQLEDMKTIIRRMGEVGIPILGYNFSIGGVCGRITGPFARGGALAVGMDKPCDDPIPNGMVWNMVYDTNAPPGVLPPTTHEQLWNRLADFLNECLPVAEKAGVALAAHPDDPPMPTLRGQPRLVYKSELYQKLIDTNPSPSNKLEFCLGTIGEMPNDDVYEATERYSRQNRIGYVHFRNVRGKAPQYQETFVDDGEIDMRRILAILHRNRFDGVIIPDHAPEMSCNAPWHAGMAYAMGYIRAALEELRQRPPEPAATQVKG